jgi:uncharacterized protein (UPF0332 family)
MSAPEIAAYLDLAGESIEAAEALIARGSFGFAASRAYYAMLYCANALLLTKGLSFSRHGAVLAAFGREFARTGLLDQKLHLYIREAFDARQVGDYDPIRKISRPTADRAVQRAKEFLDVARAYVANTQSQSGN